MLNRNNGKQNIIRHEILIVKSGINKSNKQNINKSQITLIARVE